jgi:hypothetical protein
VDYAAAAACPSAAEAAARRFSKLRCLAADHFLDLLLQLFSPKI